MPTLLAACVVSSLRPDAGSIGVTAIDKRPVDGAVKVGRFGLYADVQADRRDHGGEDRAVYAYSQEDAEFWAAELGRPLGFGWFGENLRVDGIDFNSARLGTRWRIGETVIVQATMPRRPCATFARWVGGPDERGWVKRFGDAGRLGAYLRVVTTGKIRAGDPVEVVAVPQDAPSVLDLFRA
jgi:MOSC domain-containing protein YiiM